MSDVSRSCGGTGFENRELNSRSSLPQVEVEDEDVDLLMDHGLLAWLQVLGSWILFANTW